MVHKVERKSFMIERSDTFGRGNPIPEIVVKNYLNQNRKQLYSPTATSIASSFSEDSDEDSTPTIDTLKLIKQKVLSFVSLNFLVGDLNDLQK